MLPLYTFACKLAIEIYQVETIEMLLNVLDIKLVACVSSSMSLA